MIFDRSDIDNLSGYGEVVSAREVIEKVENMIMSKLAFEPDYHDGHRIKLDVAEEFLIEMRKVIKDMGR